MRTDLPSTIQSSLHELSPSTLVLLFELELKDGSIFRLSPHGEITWLGDIYDDLPCTMTEISQDSDGKVTRPKFSFANPAGLFSYHVQSGQLDWATLTRKRVLKSDLEANNDFAITEQFRVTKILQIGPSIISVEMRDVLDSPRFKLPARAFYPPEFPHVKLI